MGDLSGGPNAVCLKNSLFGDRGYAAEAWRLLRRASQAHFRRRYLVLQR